MLSKRKLIHLVKEKIVAGWDDPRMPTIQGLRRRGYSPEGINAFCQDIGVTRNSSVIPIEKLEEFVRVELNATSRRLFAVADPVKLTLRGFKTLPATVEVANVPGIPEKGVHTLPFSSTLYIERSDFREVDEEDYFGLALKTKDGKQKGVKLKYANIEVYIVEVKKDNAGNIVELVGEPGDGTAKHAIHWIAIVPGQEPIKVEIRDYDHLYMSEEPAKVLPPLLPSSPSLLPLIPPPRSPTGSMTSTPTPSSSALCSSTSPPPASRPTIASSSSASATTPSTPTPGPATSSSTRPSPSRSAPGRSRRPRSKCAPSLLPEMLPPHA